jgi:hypothetical protein
MPKRYAFLFIVLFLVIIIYPNRKDIRNVGRFISYKYFETHDSATEENEHSSNSGMPDQPDFDSTKILQAIDSIESAPQNPAQKLLPNKLP